MIIKTQIYKEAREIITKKSYEKKDIIAFKNHELKKARWNGDDEFRMDENYYDVVEVRFEKGQKIYFCLKDGKDETLDKVRKIASSFNLKNQSKEFIPWSKTAKSLVKTYTAVISQVNYCFNRNQNTAIIKNFNSTLKIYSFSKVFIPPPERFSGFGENL